MVKAYENALTLEVDVIRREFLTLALSSATSAVLLPLDASPTRKVGTSEVELIWKFHDHLITSYPRASEAVTAAPKLLNTALGFLDGSMTQRTRQELSTAVAALADRVGWSYHEAGNPAESWKCARTALALSREGVDRTLEGHTQLNAGCYLFPADPRNSFAVSQRINEIDGMLSMVKAVNAALSAKYAATVGDARQAVRMLRLSESLIQGDPIQPRWADWFAPRFVHRHRTEAFLVLGDFTSARKSCELSCDPANPASGMVRMARVAKASGDLDQASELISRAKALNPITTGTRKRLLEQ